MQSKRLDCIWCICVVAVTVSQHPVAIAAIDCKKYPEHTPGWIHGLVHMFDSAADALPELLSSFAAQEPGQSVTCCWLASRISQHNLWSLSSSC